MSESDEKGVLLYYLQRSRDAVVWKLDGLDEYDIRRPLTPTGTNLLGLVKHLAGVELGYFGDTFDRPTGIETPWFADGADPNEDLFATAEETREEIVDLYHRAWRVTDETVGALPLHAVGHVPWWPAESNEATLFRILVHMIDETSRHAGHVDILREGLDGAVGVRPASSNMADVADDWWPGYHDRLEAIAREAAGRD
jgi:hypothetical protein